MQQRIQQKALMQENSSKYPFATMLAVLALLALAPFTTELLAVLAFAICLYRVVRYDEKVFIVDYCILIPISALMKLENSASLTIYLCLIASVWYFIKDGIKGDFTLVVLLLLLNYLLTRMQMNINDFVLLFGQIFVVYILISKQDSQSAERAVKAFCISLLISTTYAFVFRKTAALADLTGENDAAMWGTNLKRFCGLMSDPNYYMTMFAVGIALVLKLRDCGAIGRLSFWLQIIAMSIYGIISYSKSFLLIYIILLGVYIIWQFWNKKMFKGVTIAAVGVVGIFLLLTAENSPFAVVLNRITSAQSLNELSTSRLAIFQLYWQDISESFAYILFGKGMMAEAFYRDPHNIYLEGIFYIGIVGVLLVATMYYGILRIAHASVASGPRQTLLAKYIVLGIVFVIFCSLHGIFMQVFHAEMLLGILALMVNRKIMTETGE